MDDLLDLNWSSPTNPSSEPISPNPQPKKSTPVGGASSFDFLAKSNTGTSTTSSSRNGNGTPNYYSSSTTPRTATPLAPALPKPAAKPVSASNGDAFSSLLGSTSSGSSTKNMTMAQKQAQLAEERRLKEEREKEQFSGLGNWEQFSSNLTSSTTSSSSRHTGASAPLQPVPLKSSSAFEGLLQPTISRPSSSTSANRSTITHSTSPGVTKNGKGSFWDNDLLVGSSSASSSSKPPPASSTISQVADPWDFDQLAAVEPVGPDKGSNGNKGSGMRTPDPDFDFGEWRDMDDGGRGQTSGPSQARSAPQGASRKPAKPSGRSSPPPHIVGQIVEMGFSPAQARSALAKTSTGVDVQAALEGLLGEAFGKRTDDDHEAEDLGEVDDDYVERERIRRETREKEEREERRRRRRQGPSRDTIAPRSQAEREREREQAGTPIQADQILAQASEIGQSVFTKATSLWNTGKERALKAYEEQKRVYEAQLAASGAGAEGGRRGKVKDGRPRWMVEAEAEAGGEELGGPGAGMEKNGFRDDSDEDVEPVRRQRDGTNGNSNGNGNGASGSRPSRRIMEDRPKPQPQDASLFNDDPVQSRPAPQRRPEPTRSVRTPHPRTPPAPLPSRALVPADPSAIQSSSSHKTKGNEHFKLGRFTEAESSYSLAIAQLPNGHLFLVPIYNNRAATRLKLGESSGAAQDCTSAIGIIGPTYHPSKEAPLPSEIGNEVKLADAFVKAYTKRAQAWEMGEKWKQAVEDWEKILGFDSAILGLSAGKTRNLAAEGLRRSKQMLDGPLPSSSAPTPKPASKPFTAPKPQSRPAQVDRSEAVSTLRAAARVQEQEDQQKLQLKDSTEARINAWKSGKETNLRALLASLEVVLWDEVLAGGLKVGMHELITEKQVKIKYMKVIARLHPDKLDVKKTTVEQRMLANGAFGTLNEAWQAFNNA